MDLVGSIQNIENRLGGWKSGQGKGKKTPKNARPDIPDDKNDQANDAHGVPEDDGWIGRIVDTTA